MKVKYDCIECLTKQTITLATKLSDNEKTQHDIIGYGLKALSEQGFEATPPYITGLVYDYAKKLTGIVDPFETEKQEHNDIAIKLVKDLNLNETVNNSMDSFDTAVRLSIAGNIIDFSVGYDIDETLVNKSIKSSLEADLFGHQTSELEEAINQATNILFLSDNAGEIVFDQLLVSLLPTEKMKYAVKGGPIVNDATMEDAITVGMDKQVEVVSTGSSIQGTLLDYCDKAFNTIFDQADLIISKGQANYETLNHREDKNIFFLLRAKCECIAEEIGCKKDEFVIIKSKA
jgi:uncharacterized protein with ATP-grasp and redox domains